MQAEAGTPAASGDVEFPAGRHVEQQPLVVGESGHRPAEEGLGRVDHPLVAERGDGLSATVAEMRFVVHEQRRAELGGEVGDRAAADGEPSVVADRRGVGQQPPWNRAQRPDHPASADRAAER